MTLGETAALIAIVGGTLAIMKLYVWPFFQRLNKANEIIEREMTHNGGGSIKDAVTDVAANLREHIVWSTERSAFLDDLTKRFERLENKVEDDRRAMLSAMYRVHRYIDEAEGKPSE